MAEEIEQLKAQLEQIQLERDELKKQVAQLQQNAFGSWALKDRTPIKNLSDKKFIDRTVAIAGWLRLVRSAAKGTIGFLEVYDGTASVQVVASQDSTIGFSLIEDHTACIAASVFIVGKVVKSLGKGQKFEIQANELRVLGGSDASTYPLAKKRHRVEFLREIGHIRPRSRLIGAITRVRNALAYATHQFFQQKGYLYINTPIITASDCEGAGEMLQVTTLLKDKKASEIAALPDGSIDYTKDFFSKPAFLTVSGQLNAEIYACALGSVYTFGPTFRAEDSNTARHLAEFWMIEPEIAFADINDNMEIAQDYVQYCLRYVLDNLKEDMEFLQDFEKRQTLPEYVQQQKALYKQKGKTPPKNLKGFRSTPLVTRISDVAYSEFVHVSYTEAVDILNASGVEFEVEPTWGIDLGSEHERWLAETHFKCPVIVYNYPKDIKAFYMRLNEDKKTVAAMDVLVPGVGELIGGSQREERLDVLLEMIEEKGLDEQIYSWYLDLRRYGSVVHSGFGLGFERLVCYVTGVPNIREAIPFPRWPGHADF